MTKIWYAVAPPNVPFPNKEVHNTNTTLVLYIKDSIM